MAAALTAGVETMVLRWAGEQLASQRATLAAAVEAACADADEAAAASALRAKHSRAGGVEGVSPLLEAASSDAAAADDAEGRLGRLAEVADVSCGSYLNQWRADVHRSLTAALRRGATGAEEAASRAGAVVGQLREALAAVRAEAARTRAQRRAAEAESARAGAVSALEEEASRVRCRCAALEQRAREEAARQAGVGATLGAMRGDAGRLELEAEQGGAGALPLSPASRNGRLPSGTAVDRARGHVASFSALCAATPWRVDASSGSADGGEWRLRAGHADGSAHALCFTLGRATSDGSSRGVSGWRVEHIPPPSSPRGSSSGGGGGAAFADSVYGRAASSALGLVMRVRVASEVGAAVRAAGALVRESGLLVARAMAAQRRSSVALAADGACITVDSVAGRCSVAVRVPTAALTTMEAPGAVSKGLRGLRETDGVAVRVGVCAGLATPEAIHAKVFLALSGVQAGPGVLARAVAATRQGIEAAVRDA
jgi:hypothetical protein